MIDQSGVNRMVIKKVDVKFCDICKNEKATHSCPMCGRDLCHFHGKEVTISNEGMVKYKICSYCIPQLCNFIEQYKAIKCPDCGDELFNKWKCRGCSGTFSHAEVEKIKRG